MKSRKRGQNEGSIYERKDGRWCAAVSLGEGRRKYVYAPTADKARLKRDELMSRISKGEYREIDSRTLRQVGDLWLVNKERSVRPKTHASYRDLLNKHIYPSIGDKAISDIDADELEQLYLASGRSPKTIRNLHFVVKAMFSWASKKLKVDNNPTMSITAHDLPRIARRELAVLSPEEARRLMAEASGRKPDALIKFALMTGARVGEIMGLTWSRTHLENGRVLISKSLQYLNGKPTLSEPKTRASVREISIPSPVVAALRVERSRQNESALNLGNAWRNELDLVFTTQSGQPLNRHAVLRQYFRPLLGPAGLDRTLTFHSLRHTAASLMLARGVPVPVVAKILGHANPAITMALYSHALPDSERLGAKAMESMFAGV